MLAALSTVFIINHLDRNELACGIKIYEHAREQWAKRLMNPQTWCLYGTGNIKFCKRVAIFLRALAQEAACFFQVVPNAKQERRSQ
ncbi:MAG: hypothetical protein A2131_02720 [Candidatus Sungbacteria bacterium GWC2_49_10]|uniref:Uncharacterized protein n=1 Tax=Candidatus Sungbacteria bacterium GWC2_49_10 TaxID=1802263 RepID=A0A1G2K8D2_9BACT|nr:MAG: hypothetical protein A2131_02720 [Candidatus Sungbacteria bacterium GWC2_49_10]